MIRPLVEICEYTRLHGELQFLDQKASQNDAAMLRTVCRLTQSHSSGIPESVA